MPCTYFCLLVCRSDLVGAIWPKSLNSRGGPFIDYNLRMYPLICLLSNALKSTHSRKEYKVLLSWDKCCSCLVCHLQTSFTCKPYKWLFPLETSCSETLTWPWLSLKKCIAKISTWGLSGEKQTSFYKNSVPKWEEDGDLLGPCPSNLVVTTHTERCEFNFSPSGHVCLHPLEAM